MLFMVTYKNRAAVSVHVGSALAATSVHGAFPSGRDEDVVDITAVLARSILADFSTRTITEIKVERRLAWILSDPE